MLSDAEILEDLGQLKDIVESHKSPDAPLSVGSEIIDGHELPVFTKVPANLCELYRIGLADADQDFRLLHVSARYIHSGREGGRERARGDAPERSKCAERLAVLLPPGRA